MPRTPTSLRAPPEQHNLDRLEHNQQIQAERSILYVKQVILQFFPRIFQSVAVLVLHLRPAGDTRSDYMAHAVIRNLLAQPLDKLRSLRTRTYKRHISLEDAPQLRDLIQTRNAQKLPHRRDTRIVIPSPGSAGIGLRIFTHGTKLVAMEM